MNISSACDLRNWIPHPDYPGCRRYTNASKELTLYKLDIVEDHEHTGWHIDLRAMPLPEEKRLAYVVSMYLLRAHRAKLRNKNVIEVGEFLADTLGDFASWAKGRSLAPLTRHYPPGYVSRQDWYTNCCRFLICRNGTGTEWYLPTNEIWSRAPAIVDLAREGIEPKFWSHGLLEERSQELSDICVKAGNHKTRRALLESLQQQLSLRPWG